MARSRDARLISRIRRGDDSAFEQLHALHQPAILSFCAHLTGSREDAEDAVQHTFLACYDWIRASDDSLELRPWLFTVARNRCLSLLRSRRDDAVADRELEVSLPEGLTAEVERRQELRDLVHDMARLPEPQRAALVLSQLDALSYREIGTVLEVPEQKVKALVYQARSSLTSLREAREAPCFEVREELATARGAARRRRLLRRHVGQCEGCREFEVAVMRQRHDLGILLPVAPSVGLGQAIAGALEGKTAAAGGAGGATVVGGAGSGLGGTLAAIGLPGVAKIAAVLAVVGGGASGALAADLPQRVGDVAPWHGQDGEHELGGGGTAERVAGEVPVPLGENGERRLRGGRSPSGPGSDTGDLPEGGERAGVATGEEGDDAQPSDLSPAGQDDGALPPGLARRDELPPGLAKREALPPGLAKRGERANGNSDSAPGRSGQAGGQVNGNGGSGGNSQGNSGQGQGNGDGGQGQGNANGNVGQGNGGGNGNAGGSGGGQGQGQGNGGNGGGNGQGGVGGGQGNGNAGGNGNGGGNPH